MNPSPPSDHRHLDAAQGSLLLGNWRDANDELENISPAGHAHPDVLAVRWAVYTRAGRPPRRGPLRWHADWSSYYDASSRAKAGAVPTEDERPGASAAHALLLPTAERFADHAAICWRDLPPCSHSSTAARLKDSSYRLCLRGTWVSVFMGRCAFNSHTHPNALSTQSTQGQGLRAWRLGCSLA